MIIARTNESKPFPLRIWTVTAVALLIVSIGLLVSALLVKQQLKQPVEWSADTGILQSAIALGGDQGFVVGNKSNKIVKTDKAGKELWSVPTTGTVTGLDLSPDGKRLAAVTEDRKMIIMDVETGKQTAAWDVPYPAVAVKWGENGNIAVSTGLAVKYRVYTYSDAGKRLTTFNQSIAVRALAFSDSGDLVIGTNASRVMVIDAEGAKKWEFLSRAPIVGVAVEGKTIYYLDNAGNYGALNDKGKLLWKRHVSGSFVGMNLSHTASRLVFVTEFGGVQLVSAKDGAFVTKLDIPELNKDGAASGISIAPEGDKVLVFGNLAVKVNVDAMANYDSKSGIHDSLTTTLIIVLVLFVLAVAFRLLMGNPKSRKKTLLLFKRIWQSKTAYLLLVPTVALLLLFNYYPAVSAFYHAFTDWRPGARTHFIGWDNFKKVADSHYFYIGLKNLLYLVVTHFLKLAVPLAVAVIVFHIISEKVRYWIRNLFVFPIVMPSIVGVLVWQFIYDPNYGLLNNILTAVGLDSWTHSWLGETNTALTSIIFIGIPWISPFAFLVFYGGLIGIPNEIYEAGKLDGIGRFRRFFSLELPLLTAQVRLLLVLTFIGTMQEFNAIYLTTAGGPMDSTYVPALELYYSAAKFSDYGYASAIGVVLFAAILVGTLFQMRMKSSVEYDA